MSEPLRPAPHFDRRQTDKCPHCAVKDGQIVDLQHMLREAAHVEGNLLAVIGLLKQRLDKLGESS